MNGYINNRMTIYPGHLYHTMKEHKHSWQADISIWNVKIGNVCLSHIVIIHHLYTMTLFQWPYILSFSLYKKHKNNCQIKYHLTLALLVANLANAKTWKKPEKWLKPWQMGTHLRALSESFQMNTNMTGFEWFSRLIAFWFHGWKWPQHWKG